MVWVVNDVVWVINGVGNKKCGYLMMWVNNIVGDTNFWVIIDVGY